MEQVDFFPYDWNLVNQKGDDLDHTLIRVYGLDEKNNLVAVIIRDFEPYIYLEIPAYFNERLAVALKNQICEKIKNGQEPTSMKLVFKKRLYGADFDMNGKRKLFPYFRISFKTPEHIYDFKRIVRFTRHWPGLGKVSLKVHEDNAHAVLQLCCSGNIPVCGWITFEGRKKTLRKETRCELEYDVSWQKLKANEDIHIVPRPLILSYDLEVYSSVGGSMPKHRRPADEIFQISCILGRQGDDGYEEFLLTLGEPNPDVVGERVEIRMFETEAALIVGFTEFIQEWQPSIITGYNIFTFDIDYTIHRAKFCSCFYEYARQGLNRTGLDIEKTIEWGSQAFQNQKFLYLHAEGRLFVDLLPVVRRDHKFRTYTLKVVSDFFLGETKDPLTYEGIFRCYRLGMKGYRSEDKNIKRTGARALGICGKYCMQDSALVWKLFETLQTWVGLTEMSRICNTQIFFLFTQGQQVKVFSQVYKKCMEAGYVVEKDGFQAGENESYTGGHVFEPMAGVHDLVFTLDFQSLYPSLIIAYNICWSTWVQDGSDIPDEDCHIFDWYDHYKCEHDTVKRSGKKAPICEPRYYRFLKKPKGVMPELCEQLLGARAKVKGRIKEVLKEKNEKPEKEAEYNTLLNVLDKRQLAYKISCNSMYGILGVTKGYLPFMPGAMCVTAKGRESIQKVSKIAIEEFKLIRIYGDSVTGDTPLLLRDDRGNILIQSVESLGEEWKDYDGFKVGQSNRKEKQQAVCDLKIWAVNKKNGKGKWAKIKRVIRHKTLKKLYRVNTHKGCVDVTEDHSLMNVEGEKVQPTEVEIGTELMHSFPKEFPEMVILRREMEDLKKKRCSKCKEEKPGYEFYRTGMECKKCVWKDNEKNRVQSRYPNGYFSETEYQLQSGTNLSEEEAWVWGFFMADGSCGSYPNKNGVKYSWALNNQNLEYLEKAKEYIKICEPHFGFKILDTIKSSGVYKLVPSGNVKFIVEKYRKLLYYRKYKIVPDIILNSLEPIKISFLDGYYVGDGSKTGQCGWEKNSLQFSAKGKLGAQGLYYILKSLGYKANITTREDKIDIFRITTCRRYRKSPIEIKKIIELGETKEDEFVYDIETELGTFSGGIGELALFNTDSVLLKFPSLEDTKEIWDRAISVAAEISKHFPPPMKLLFEMAIYKRFMILTKKRYMGIECDRDGEEKPEISKKGVMLVRRDNSQAVRDPYASVVMDIFNRVPEKEVIESLVEKIMAICRGELPYKHFIITKRVGEISEYKIRPLSEDEDKKAKRLADLNCTEEDYKFKSLPAQAQLLLKMQSRGENVGAGTRLEYVVTTTGGHKARQFVKIEDATYFMKHTSILKIDFLYYIQNLSTQMDQVLEVVYGRKKFVLLFYRQLRKTFEQREKLIQNLEKYLRPEIKLKEVKTIKKRIVKKKK